jgi:hypothetical protein
MNFSAARPGCAEGKLTTSTPFLTDPMSRDAVRHSALHMSGEALASRAHAKKILE